MIIIAVIRLRETRHLLQLALSRQFLRCQKQPMYRNQVFQVMKTARKQWHSDSEKPLLSKVAPSRLTQHVGSLLIAWLQDRHIDWCNLMMATINAQVNKWQADLNAWLMMDIEWPRIDSLIGVPSLRSKCLQHIVHFSHSTPAFHIYNMPMPSWW